MSKFIIFVVLSILFNLQTLSAQFYHPEVEEVYGGRILAITTVENGSDSTRVFISTESANSIFYADVDHAGSLPVYNPFQALADADTNDGFGKNVRTLAADAASGRLFFIANSQLHSCFITPGSITQLEPHGVIGVLAYGSHLFYLKMESSRIDLHFGSLDPVSGAFSENSGSPITAIAGGVPGPNNYHMAVNPANDSLYIFEPGTPPGIYVSSEKYNLLTSSSIFSTLSVTGLGNLYEYHAFGLGPDGRIFAGTVAGIEPNHGKFIGYSDDNGASWDTLHTGIGGTSGSNIACAGTPADYSIFFGTAASNNKGQSGSWQYIGHSSFETHPNDGAIAVDPMNNQVIYMTTDQGIGASENRGSDIFEINDGVEAVQVNDFDMDGAKSTAWAASKSGIRQVSNYNTPSESWSIFFPNGDGSPYFSIAMDTSDHSGNTAYAGNLRVYKTSNGGSSWNQIFTTETAAWNFDFWSYISAIAVHPSNNQLIFTGVNSPSLSVTGGIFYSTDAGTNWTRLSTSPYNTEVQDFMIVENSDGSSTIYVACEYVSDGTTSSYGVKTISYDPTAGTFTFDNTMPGSSGTSITNFGANDLAINSDGDVYAAGRKGSDLVPRIYIKYADSTHWELLPYASLPPAGNVSAITIGEDPSLNEVPFIAIDNALYYYEANTTWTLAFEYAVGMDINVLFWDDLLVGTGTGLYGHTFNTTAIPGNKTENLAQNFRLEQNYPNPFNGCTAVQFYLPIRSSVNFLVYNLSGQLIHSDERKNLDSGNHRISFYPRNLPSGVYFYQLVADHFQGVKKMIYIK